MNYKEDDLKRKVSECRSFNEVARSVGLNRANCKFIKKVRSLGIDLSHFSYKLREKKDIEQIVMDSKSVAEVARKLGLSPNSGSSNWLAKKIKFFGIDTSHFLGQRWSVGKSFVNKRRSADQILVLKKSGKRERRFVLKRAMLETGIKEVCKLCGQTPVWNDKPLVLEIDHENGNPLDDRRENLRFVCPNCHTQTVTFGNRKRQIM